MMRPGNDNNGWVCVPVVSNVAYNQFYVSIGSNNRIGLNFSDTWGYGCILRIKRL